LNGTGDVIYGLCASLIAAGVSTAGILSIAAFGSLAQRYSAYFSAFAMGLLTAGVLFHLIPEAVSYSPTALGWVGGGFIVMVLVGIAIQTTVTRNSDGAALTFGYASIIALAVHSYIDGAIYAAVFRAEAFTGWLTTGGLLLHEFPEGVIAFFLLKQAGLGHIRSILLAFIAAAVTTVAGTLTGNFVLTLRNELPIGQMLGAAAGALIYILIFHLGPHGAKVPNRRGYLVAELGVIVAIGAVILKMIGGGH